MPIPTNTLKHTASPTNTTRSGRVLKTYTMAELAALTLAELADYTFDSIYFTITSLAKHTGSVTNTTKH